MEIGTRKIKKGRYRHYKGKEYQVTGVARHSETNELMVVYKALYKSEKFGDRAWWVRPLEMFTGEVKVNGKRVSRFEFVGDD
jgi:hypothetical protein